MTKCTTRNLHLPIALSALACLCWFTLACGGDEPEVSDTPDYEATIAAALAKAGESAPTLEPTATAAPTPAPTPTEIPPSPTPTDTPTSTPVAPANTDIEPLAALAINDVEEFLTDVAEAERDCLSAALPTDRLAALLVAPELANEAERTAVLGCLGHDTSLRLFMTPVLSATGPISAESSTCLRRSYANHDLTALMTRMLAANDPGSEGEAAQVEGMVTFVVSLSCLSEQEFQMAAPAMGIEPGEYENFQCVLERVGGPDALAVLLTPAAEFPAALFEAALECQVQMADPPPG